MRIFLQGQAWVGSWDRPIQKAGKKSQIMHLIGHILLKFYKNMEYHWTRIVFQSIKSLIIQHLVVYFSREIKTSMDLCAKTFEQAQPWTSACLVIKKKEKETLQPKIIFDIGDKESYRQDPGRTLKCFLLKYNSIHNWISHTRLSDNLSIYRYWTVDSSPWRYPLTRYTDLLELAWANYPA